jgi:PleD family two-component response regulator
MPSPEEHSRQNPRKKSLKRHKTAISERSYAMIAKSQTRILVVEDDDIVRRTISKLLSDEGYDVPAQMTALTLSCICSRRYRS